ncbi:Galactoside 2-alpha-L-fucosyltransferase 1, partial [Armadillidium vulgare]
TLICTHIRRSDYLKYGERIKLIFPTKVFYRNAFEFYRKNCKNSVFVVVSDDLEWCKEHLSDQDVVFPEW